MSRSRRMHSVRRLCMWKRRQGTGRRTVGGGSTTCRLPCPSLCHGIGRGTTRTSWPRCRGGGSCPFSETIIQRRRNAECWHIVRGCQWLHGPQRRTAPHGGCGAERRVLSTPHTDKQDAFHALVIEECEGRPQETRARASQVVFINGKRGRCMSAAMRTPEQGWRNVHILVKHGCVCHRRLVHVRIAGAVSMHPA